ncbi:hypothetical protein ABMA57_06530 [Saccharospirillum sp. HFRX-1]|uniref:hypothetical protein n=1 Tax=unclassified Saccharospirillum TaxID=2633430 RepID=UPI0037230BCD
MKRVVCCLLIFCTTGLRADEINTWLEAGNVDNELDGTYLGFSTYKGHIGVQVGTVIAHEKLYFVSDDDPTFATETVDSEGLVFVPLHVGMMAGFDVNERLTTYTSLGLMYWERCEVVKNSVDQYCRHNDSYLRLIPGVGVHAKLLQLNRQRDWDHLSLMANYHYRLGLGSSFGLGLSYSL